MRRAVLRKLRRNWSRVCWHWCLLHSRLCLVLMAPAAPTQFRLANIDHAGCLDVICNRPSQHLLWHSKVASCGYMCRCSMNGSKECFNFCFVYACRQAHVCKSRRMKDRQLQIARRDFVWYDWTCSAGSQDALRRLIALRRLARLTWLACPLLCRCAEAYACPKWSYRQQ